MSYEKYSTIWEEEMKEALVANRREPVSKNIGKNELLAYGIKLYEEQLMNKTLSYEEIAKLREGLAELKEGKISEELMALYRERKRKELDEALADLYHEERNRHYRGEHHVKRHIIKGPVKHAEEDTQDSAESSTENDGFSFDDLHLKIGDRLQLEPSLVIFSDRYIVNVIGYLKGSSIIVTTPVEANGLPLHLEVNDKVIMRSFSGQNVFAFTSKVLLINKTGFGYLHLSFPENIEGFRLRNAIRIRANIIATVTNEKIDKDAHQSAMITDISEDGASLISKQPLGEMGDVIHLAFRIHLHNIEVVLSANGIIRKASNDDDTEAAQKETYYYGLEFQDLQTNDHVVLQSMIYQQMIENPRSIM